MPLLHFCVVYGVLCFTESNPLLLEAAAEAEKLAHSIQEKSTSLITPIIIYSFLFLTFSPQNQKPQLHVFHKVRLHKLGKGKYIYKKKKERKMRSEICRSAARAARTVLSASTRQSSRAFSGKLLASLLLLELFELFLPMF